MSDSLGAAADKLYRMNEQISTLEQQIKLLKSKRATASEVFLNRLTKSEIASAKGKLCNVAIKKEVVPTIEDWEVLNKYIKRYDAFDLYQRRLSSKAYRDRIAAGKKVPGVKTFNRISLSITKRKV